MPAVTRRTTVASQTTAVTNPEPVGLLIFDGDCGFCTSVARRFDAIAGARASVSPWQAADLDALGLIDDDVATAAYWVGADGTAFRGADAFAQGLKACKGPWRVAGYLVGAPPLVWLTRALYPTIAKYRHQLPGATDSCRIDVGQP